MEGVVLTEFTNTYYEFCTNRQILYGVGADSAGTWEFLCTNTNYVLSGVGLTGNHLYLAEQVSSKMCASNQKWIMLLEQS